MQFFPQSCNICVIFDIPILAAEINYYNTLNDLNNSASYSIQLVSEDTNCIIIPCTVYVWMLLEICHSLAGKDPAWPRLSAFYSPS